MKILFIGYVFQSNDNQRLSGSSDAGNKMQLNIIKELCVDHNIDVLTIHPVATFPKEKKIFIKMDQFIMFDNVNVKRISFLNIPFIKQIWQILSMWNSIRSALDKDTIVLTFNLFPQIGIPIRWLKRKYNNKVVSLIADLPLDDNRENRGFFSAFLRRIFDESTIKSIKNADNLIVLNENVIQKYSLAANYIVMEGGISKSDIADVDYKHEKKSLVYSGALTEYSGVVNLISAMEQINEKDLVLEIYGNGPLVQRIVSLVKDKDNIRYCGMVLNSEMLEIQRAAFLLINPRPVEDEISKVTFPSKMFEYMASGTPVISTKISGLTSEYLDKMYLFSDSTPSALAIGINRVCSLSIIERKQIAVKAREFILLNKSWNIQSRKITTFMSNKYEGGNIVD